ncbi:MAG: hypothetical protein GW936_01770 [Gallionella sp.]|nr:hypothetical protein [Gallionella sp.]OIO09318.1 MAG: hypothetical protein AUJ80_04585 [Gallionellaceae bacterium CG1_02_60_325]PIR10363.1 MAG: hypothetical protein COV51_00315 [Gallionellaceae bacterium CG11_big_fil_rev_8_21_14_0_20_60_62]PIV48186.1 MAG: hypothetical protein COS20_00845 [Gallionellaceae bacterium CG02_land_8_20_14_3_00_60_115]PIY05426.1 MAG: hypothetical protein COZ19_03190 [Gallionellaceae bacterium CG_4_10_14_3_um_filter_60_1069]PJC04474.1 MAG: hypothetical protein CO069
MLIRLALMLSALFIAAAVVAYLFTRDARYLKRAVQVARFVLFLLMVFGVVFLLERYGFVAWRVFS